MLKIVGMTLLLAATAFLLRQFGWSGAPVFAAVCAVVLLGEMSATLGRIIEFVSVFGETSSVSEPIGAAIKTLGAGYLFGISADVCRELGESGIAKAVEAVGRVEIIAIVIPYFQEIIKVGVELIG